MDIASLRKEYTRQQLSETDADPNPLSQFQKWFEQAVAAQVPEPHAMTLATATPDGKPSARVVLLRGADERGFVFYTNMESRKGRELRQNPLGALVFYWAELERQVRIEGPVEPVADEEADAYFQSRPRGSQLGAWASRQSEPIPSRAVLEQRVQELTEQYEGRPVPRPPYWGGFRLRPTAFEFWQGRPSRLHDRILYTPAPDGGWAIQRLSP